MNNVCSLSYRVVPVDNFCYHAVGILWHLQASAWRRDDIKTFSKKSWVTCRTFNGKKFGCYCFDCDYNKKMFEFKVCLKMLSYLIPLNVLLWTTCVSVEKKPSSEGKWMDMEYFGGIYVWKRLSPTCKSVRVKFTCSKSWLLAIALTSQLPACKKCFG